MKDSPKHKQPELPQRWEDAYEAFELRRLIRLDMNDEALRCAREALKQKPLSAETFNAALDAIISVEEGKRRWAKLVESAYQRLPGRQRWAVRFMMMSFLAECQDHDGVLELAPRRLAGEFALVELGLAIQAAFVRVQTEVMKRLARWLPRVIRRAKHRG